MSLKTSIIVRFQFEGFHYWEDAPVQHAFLREPHRHMFHVEAVKQVVHTNRDIEFIQFRRVLEQHCLLNYGGNQFRSHGKSCEMIAMELVQTYELSSCRVFEDNENGAEVVQE